MTKFLAVLVIFVVVKSYHYGSAEESILEQGKLAVIGAIAKAKEIADRGISVKSERQQSYDIFGLKFGTNNGIETGFGDAATEKNLEKIEDDLFRRRKRSLAVLEALKAAGLFNTNSAVGTNVNIVKINSVSNVNNYGPTTTPEATTESAKRRRRLIGDSRNPTIYGELEEKVSYTSSDIQMDKNAKFQSHTKGGTQSKHLVQMEQNEIEGPIVRNRRSLDKKNDPEKVKLDDWIEDDTGKIFGAPRMKRALVLSEYENKISYFQSDSEAKSDGSTKTHTFSGSHETKLSKISEEPGLSRAKRSPQDMDSDVMPTDMPPQNGTGGPPRGPPPGEGGKGGGGGGRGRGGPGGPGRGKGRRPPCPPPSEESNEEASDGQRRKREVHQGNQSDSSYYSDSLSSEEEGSRRKKREIDANADNGNGAVSDSSFYSDSLSSDSSSSSSEESDPNTGAEETTENDSQRVKRSPCKGGSRPTTPAPGGMRRRKREAESQSAEVENVNEKVDQNLSFFTDVMEKFFKAVKKVADTAKQVFNGGRRDAEGSNPNAEII